MLSTEEQQNNRAAWIGGLSSGDYPQAKQQLRGSQGYCCLGVLAVVCGWTETEHYEFVAPAGAQTGLHETRKASLEAADLCYMLGVSLPLARAMLTTAINLNDTDGLPFPRISVHMVTLLSLEPLGA